MNKSIQYVIIITIIAVVSIISSKLKAQCNFTLGNDTSICSPSTLVLHGPANYTSYLWSPGGSTTQNITVGTSGTYALTGTLMSGDLIVNGNFSAGNTGFTSSYGPPAGGSWGPLSVAGTYMVSNNPNATHSNFMSFGDHTTGTGLMFVCNGASVANTIVWTETIALNPNTNYNFSAWVASLLPTLNNGDQAQLQFSINGVLIGPVHNAPLNGGIWSNFAVTWNSGANTSGVITIVDQSTNAGSNDFALDDIFFQEVCVHTDTIVVTVSPVPIITPSAVPSTICSGSSSSLTATSNVAGTTFNWTPGNLIGSSVTVNPPSSIIYTVAGTAAGCTGTSTVTVMVNPHPIVSSTASPAAICMGTSTTLTATSTVAGTTFNWMPGNLTGSSVSVSPTTTTTYTVTGTALGCTGTSTVTVTVKPNPVVTSTATPSVICVGDSSTLSATSTVVGTTYNWMPGNLVGSSVRVSPAATTNYTVTGTAVGCTGTSTVALTVNPHPVVTATATPTAICVGGSSTLSATSDIVGTTYNWMPGNLNGSPVTVSPAASATYIVTGTALGCTDTASVTVTVNPIPVIQITPLSPSICVGDSITLHASSNIGGSTFSWDNGLIGDSIRVSPPNTISFKVIGTSNLCYDSASVVVTVNPIPQVSISPTNPAICFGDSIALTASSNLPLTNFTWSSNATTTSIFAKPAVTSPFFVVGELNQCIDTAFINVTVNPLPVVSITASINPICEGDASTLSAASNIPLTSYNWNTSITTNSIVVTPFSSSWYYVTGTVNNCRDSASIFINVIPHQTVNLGLDQIICEGDQVILSAGNLAGSFLWSDGSTSNTFTVSSAGLYWLVVNNSGCIASDSVIFDPCNQIWVPSAFTPNGDTKNDIFKSSHIGIESLTMYVFNRWGEVIYTTMDMEAGWDGTYKGKEAQEGVYYWLIKYKERSGYDLKEKDISGSVTLFR